MTYSAIVARLENVRKHTNADRLQVATVCGDQVIVGMDVAEGDLGVYFPTDGELSMEFAQHHDLISRIDENGKRAGGFFGKNRHVRAQNFRGERSCGFWMPLSCLDFTYLDPLTTKTPIYEGYEFSEFNGVPICRKYINLATQQCYGVGMWSSKPNTHFAEHVKTLHMKRSASREILPGDLVIVTEKLHGTSGRVGNVLTSVPRPQNFISRMVYRLFGWEPPTQLEYKVNLGTRRRVVQTPEQRGYHGSESFRWKAVETIVDKLKPGEILYGEIVGYTETGRSIMGQHDTRDLKEVNNVYGDVITFSYGCEPGKCKFYVYRITQDGQDLPWMNVMFRCAELGIPFVPFIDVYTAGTAGQKKHDVDTFTHSSLDKRHPIEGVVYRVERGGNVRFLKDKTYVFDVLEGQQKTDANFVDAEEAA